MNIQMNDRSSAASLVDWYDRAYEELESLRDLYYPQILQLCCEKNSQCFLLPEDVAISNNLKAALHFLGFNRYDISQCNKDTVCYYLSFVKDAMRINKPPVSGGQSNQGFAPGPSLQCVPLPSTLLNRKKQHFEGHKTDQIKEPKAGPAVGTVSEMIHQNHAYIGTSNLQSTPSIQENKMYMAYIGSEAMQLKKIAQRGQRKSRQPPNMRQQTQKTSLKKKQRQNMWKTAKDISQPMVSEAVATSPRMQLQPTDTSAIQLPILQANKMKMIRNDSVAVKEKNNESIRPRKTRRVQKSDRDQPVLKSSLRNMQHATGEFRESSQMNDNVAQTVQHSFPIEGTYWQPYASPFFVSSASTPFLQSSLSVNTFYIPPPAAAEKLDLPETLVQVQYSKYPQASEHSSPHIHQNLSPPFSPSSVLFDSCGSLPRHSSAGSAKYQCTDSSATSLTSSPHPLFRDPYSCIPSSSAAGSTRNPEALAWVSRNQHVSYPEESQHSALHIHQKDLPTSPFQSISPFQSAPFSPGSLNADFSFYSPSTSTAGNNENTEVVEISRTQFTNFSESYLHTQQKDLPIHVPYTEEAFPPVSSLSASSSASRNPASCFPPASAVADIKPLEAPSLLGEFICLEMVQKTDDEMLPLKRLCEVVKSMSPAALNAAVEDIRAVMGVDFIAGINFSSYCGMKCVVDSTVPDLLSCPTEIPGRKRPRVEMGFDLLGETMDINEDLTETVVQQVSDCTERASRVRFGEGITLRCSYRRAGLGGNFNNQPDSSRKFVPASYLASSLIAICESSGPLREFTEPETRRSDIFEVMISLLRAPAKWKQRYVQNELLERQSPGSKMEASNMFVFS